MFKPSNPRSIKQLSTSEEEGPQKRTGARVKRTEGSPRKLKIRWVRGQEAQSAQRTRRGPSSLKAPVSESLSGSPAEAAEKFLSQNRELLGLADEPGELKMKDCVESKGATHIRFQQTYEGLPVHGGEVSVHLDHLNQVQMVNGEYLPKVSLPRRVRGAGPITKAEAIEAAIQDLGPDTTLKGSASAEMIIYPVQNQYVKAYKVTFPASKPLGDWVYFINAENGKVIDSYNAMRFEVPRGSIYNSSPKHSDVQIVELNRLDNSGKLQGSFVKVENAMGEEARSTNGEFIYEPDNPHFDEVMAYFHVDKAHVYFTNLGFKASDNPIQANVHVPDPETKDPDYDNAYFSPETHQIYFGHGKKMNDLAKESAVIYHEYTHSIIEHIRPEIEGAEGAALHEGYADYFACSITDDPLIGEYAVQKLGLKAFRDLTSNKKYPDDYKEGDENAHGNGEIWGASCWDLRELLGARVADLLVYESLHYLPKTPKFEDAYEGIRQADTALYNGTHLPQIENLFSHRGIASTTPTPQPPEIKERNLSIRSNQAWTSTGITVKKGQEISIAATGKIIYDDKGNSCGPDGASWTDTRDKEDPLYTKPHAGLIARVGVTGTPFFVGSKFKAKMNVEGILYLGINDAWYKGNSGQFSVTIKY